MKPPKGKVAVKGTVRLTGSPTTINNVLATQRAQLMGVIELRGVRRLRKSYEIARAELRSKLRAATLTLGSDSFTAHHLRIMLAQTTDALRMFEQRLDKHLKDTGKLAQALAPRHLVESVKKLETTFTGHAPVVNVGQASVLRGIYEKTTPSLLDRYAASSQLYSAPVIDRVKLELTQSLLQGESMDEAIDRVDDVVGGERWRAERIVRTELSYTYGATQQVAMQEMQQDMPGMQKKLIETFDDRTGEDSKELHGQVQDVDKPFIWNKVTKKGVEVVEYMMPPNRPNDRAVVIPWMPGWTDSATTAPGGEGPGDVPSRAPSEGTEKAAKLVP